MNNSRSELRAALIWIGIYVIAMSVGETLNDSAGVLGVVTAPLGLALTMALCLYLRRTNDFGRLGFQRMEPPAFRRALYCLPLLALVTVNLWRGAVLRFSPLETTLYVIAMLCTGFLEETIFRGLLLRALLKQGVKTALLISSLTFGLGHIVNLLNGAELLPTLLQLIYAMAIGLMLAVFVLRVGSVIPCILFHSVFNALSAFGNDVGQTVGGQIATSAAITVLALGYAAWLWFRLPKAMGEESAAE